MRKEKNLTQRSFEGKNYTQFLFFLGGGIDTNSAKMGSECTICIRFSKIFSRKIRSPPPLLREDKKFPLFGLFSTTTKVKFFRITYMRFESKNYTQFLRKNRHELGKNGLRMHHLHLFFKNFLFSRGDPDPPPPPPTARR